MDADRLSPTQGDQHPSPEAADLDHWKLVYSEARRAFDFRVQEVQNEQQRNAIVLTTNGLLLAFVAATTGVFVPGPASPQAPICL